MSRDPYAPPTADLVETRCDAVVIREAHLSHEASVKSIAYLYYFGAVGVVLSSLSLFGSRGYGSPEDIGYQIGRIFGGLLVAALLAWLGIELRRLNRRVRFPVGVLSVLGLFAVPLGTLIHGYILYLIFSKKGATVFSDEYQAVIAATPGMRYESPTWVKAILGILLVVLVVFILIAALR